MEQVTFDYQLSKEAQQERKQLVDTLLASTIIQEWLHTYQLDESMVDKHAYKLKDYVSAKQTCIDCVGLSMCMQSTKGYILELEYDGAICKNARPCHYQKIENDMLKHKQQFSLCDMSDQQLCLSFDDIVLESEKATYIALVNDMVLACEQAKEHGFFLCGEPGTGKTYLACCFLNEMAKKGKRCAFINVANYMASLKATMYDKEAYQKLIQTLKEVEVAVFDDIGGESASNWSRDEILLPILNERMEKHRTTLFTSNYDMENLSKYYAFSSKLVNDEVGAKRLVERMKALSLQKVVNGVNRRFKK